MEEKICPLTNEPCRKEKCAFALVDNEGKFVTCGLYALACEIGNLRILIEKLVKLLDSIWLELVSKEAKPFPKKERREQIRYYG